MSKNDKVQGEKQGNLLLKYIVALLISLVCFSVLVTFGVIAYGMFKEPPPTVENVLPEPDFTIQGQDYSEVDVTNPLSDFLLPPEKTNFLLTGTDQGNLLTDVIILGSFDRVTNEINLVSIPRDTSVTVPKDEVSSIHELGRYFPSSGQIQINQIHSYIGQEYGMLYLQRQIERMFEIKIHYYARVNLSAFRKIVDDIGGVTMEIPSGGLYYSDPEQNLTISVPSGMQLLDGKMAEGVVRYRSTYVQGDIDRVDVQQDFLKALFNKILTTETLISTAPQLAATFLNYVTTNFTIQDIPKYLPFINNLTTSSLTTQTMPFHWIAGVSYVLPNEEEIKVLSETIFYSAEVEEEIEEETEAPNVTNEPIDSKDLRIQILNGGEKRGTATAYSEMLKSEGFNVVDVGDYTGTKEELTRIFHSNNSYEAEASRDLRGYFITPEFEIDEEIPSDYDVIIIIGKDEKDLN